MKRRIVLLLALAFTAAPAVLAHEGRGEGCACAPRFERPGPMDRPPGFQDRGSVESPRRLRELRRTRADLERVLRRFDRDGDGRLGEAERRRIRAIRELRERRRERLWELRERRWERMREARERMRGLRDRGERRRGDYDPCDGAGLVF